MEIKRTLENQIIDKLITTKKAVILYGPRQVGKTTLVNRIIKKINVKTLSINADEKKYNDILSSRDFSKIKRLIGDNELLFIDEAQRIKDIGLNLKIIKDNLPDLKVIVTGSSSFELANKVSEAMTGRVWTYNLYPIAVSEIKNFLSNFEIDEKQNELLVFGSYPEVFTTEKLEDKEELLKEIGNSYLYKDVLNVAEIKYSDKMQKLLQLLSFQIGQEVSITELARQLEINRETVERYIYLLEKTFIIFRLSGFNRNLRKEVSKKDKIFFYDLGIRNMVIDNFKSLENRNDVGQLWENFLILERIKYLKYSKKTALKYFWRLRTGAEIDYVEEAGGTLVGYEFKYGQKKSRIPQAWLDNYEKSQFKIVNRDNYLDFIAGNKY